MTKKQLHPACRHCGSASVRVDAWADWNFETQKWEVADSFDNGMCDICDGETKVEWKQGKPFYGDPRIKIGSTVRWNDPDGGKCSGEFTVDAITEDGGENDVLSLTNESGSAVEAFRYEVQFVEGGEAEDDEDAGQDRESYSDTQDRES